MITFLWMGVIFLFTQLPMFTGKNTGIVVDEVVHSVHSQTSSQSDGTESKVNTSSLNLIIRKLAHVCVFGLLAVFIFQVIKQKKHSYLLAWLFTVVYAVFDEYHQSFITGRVATIRDVGFDAVGATLAIFVVYQRSKNKKTQCL